MDSLSAAGFESLKAGLAVSEISVVVTSHFSRHVKPQKQSECFRSETSRRSDPGGCKQEVMFTIPQTADVCRCTLCYRLTPSQTF